MYRGVVYVRGPMTNWGGKIDQREIIFDTHGRWRWLVTLLTKSAYGPLDHLKCGYAITCDDSTIEHVAAEAQS